MKKIRVPVRFEKGGVTLSFLVDTVFVTIDQPHFWLTLEDVRTFKQSMRSQTILLPKLQDIVPLRLGEAAAKESGGTLPLLDPLQAYAGILPGDTLKKLSSLFSRILRKRDPKFPPSVALLTQ